MTPEEQEWITDYGGLLNMLAAAEQSVVRALAKASERLPSAHYAPGDFVAAVARAATRAERLRDAIDRARALPPMPNPAIQRHLERWYSHWREAAQLLIDTPVSDPLDDVETDRYGHALARYADLIKAGGDAAGAAREAGLGHSLN